MESVANRLSVSELLGIPTYEGITNFYRGQTVFDRPPFPIRSPLNRSKADFTCPINGLPGMIDTGGSGNVFTSTNQVTTYGSLSAAGSSNMMIWADEFAQYTGSWPASVLAAIQTLTGVTTFAAKYLAMIRVPNQFNIMSVCQATKNTGVWSTSPGGVLLTGISTVRASFWATAGNFVNLNDVGRTPANYTGTWGSHVITGVSIADMESVGFGVTVNYNSMCNFNPLFPGTHPQGFSQTYETYVRLGNQSFSWIMLAPINPDFYLPVIATGSISALSYGFVNT